MSDILTVGNAKIDVFVILNNLNNFSYDKFSNQISFPLGAKIPFGDHPLALGGNACNVAVGLSKLGFGTSLAACVGKDEFSEKILNELKINKVNTDYIQIENTTNPSFNIALSFQGERTILEEENLVTKNLNVPSITPKLIYLTSVAGDWKKIYDETISNNPYAELALNPGSKMLAENLDDVIALLPKIKYLFVNLQEAQKLIKTENPDIKFVITKLHSLGSKIVVVTDSINGSYAYDESNQFFHMGVARKEKPIEKTGAGDAYASGFIYGILNKHSIDEAMKYGSLNADSAIQKIGAQDGLLTSAQIEEISRNKLDFQAVRI